MTRKCRLCGDKFKPKSYDFRRGYARFCSRECYYKSIRNNTIVICKECGISFHVKPHRKKNNKNGIFCSNVCKGKWASRNRVGDLSPSWKGGKLKLICHQCGIEYKKDRSELNHKSRFCSHSCRAIYTMVRCKKSGTSIENKISEELSKRGIKFVSQYPITNARTIPDFFIEPNICIYADGNYWHNLPRQKVVDSRQNIRLKELGYIVYRFWEKDINNNVKKCVDRIII